MSHEDVIKMLREVGVPWQNNEMVSIYVLQRFAALVAAAEREACAQACEGLVPTVLINGERWLKDKNGNPDVRLKDLAPELESRWEAEQILKNGSAIENYAVQHRCAAVIRARKTHE